MIRSVCIICVPVIVYVSLSVSVYASVFALVFVPVFVSVYRFFTTPTTTSTTTTAATTTTTATNLLLEHLRHRMYQQPPLPEGFEVAQAEEQCGGAMLPHLVC